MTLTRDMLAAHDFTMVRAALVRELKGDVAAAIVLTRIHWRLSQEAAGSWWRCSARQIADETGLSEDQVNRHIKKLRDTGYLETRMEQRDDPRDRTLSYRLLWSDSSQTADTRCHPANPQRSHTADSRDVPSLKDLELKTPPTPPLGVSHLHEPNAQRALDTLHADRSLPLDVGELLSHAYRLGDGDPWEGYLQIKSRTEWKLGPSRDPAAVLRHRLLAEAAS